jgi:hypothetical protein
MAGVYTTFIAAKPNPMAETAEKPQFDIDSALNQASFVSFVAAHPEADKIDMGDTDGVEKLFKTFEAYEEAKEQAKPALAEMFQEESGLKLDGKQLGSVEKALLKQAVENPDSIISLSAAFAEKKASEEAVKLGEEQIGRELEAVQKEIETLKAKAGKIDTGLTHMSFFGKARHYLQGFKGVFTDDDSKISAFRDRSRQIAELKLEYGKETDADTLVAELKKLEGEISSKERASADTKAVFEVAKENLKGRVALCKMTIIDSVAAADEVRYAMRAAIVKSTTAAFKAGDVKSLDALEERFSKIEKEGGSLVGQQIFSATEIKNYRDRLDKASEAAITAAIEKAVTDTPVGNNALKQLEDKIVAFGNRENIGAKGSGRVFVLETLAAEIAKLGTGPATLEKRILLNRLVAKLSK